MRLPDLTDLAVSNTQITVRVTPKASRNCIEQSGDMLRVYVTTIPENGKANAAVTKLLAKALGVSKSRLSLIRGHSARDKTFEIL